MEQLRTILNSACAEIEEKKSRFIANIFYVENVEQAEEKLKQIKKKYFDAKHNCYAYRIKQGQEIKQKASDDGEPSGTAGSPILNILIKNQILNVIVIVTRYFGGTLLGTGGLVRAYTNSVIKTINQAQSVVLQQGEEAQIELKYNELEKFKYYCEKNNINIKSTSYEKSIKCIIELNEEEKEKLINQEQNNVNILEYKLLSKRYITKNIEF